MKIGLPKETAPREARVALAPVSVARFTRAGLALPRVMIAVMETYQRADGAIAIPKPLQPYTGFSEITR